MSRSRKKTPIAGITTVASDKEWKRRANRRHRRIVNMVDSQAASGHEVVYPLLREVADVWDGEKDGKRYYGANNDDEYGIMRK